MKRLASIFALLLTANAAHAGDTEVCIEAAEQGQILRDKGQLVAARDRFVTCSQRACPLGVRRDCTGWLEDVDRRVPSVTFGAKEDAGADVVDVAIMVDGKKLTPDGRASLLDPGVHKATFEARDGRKRDASFVLHEGEKSRLVSVIFASERRAVSSPPPKEPSIVPPIVTGALAVGAAGVFAGLYFPALSRRDDLAARCGRNCPSDEVDGIVRDNTIAVVALAASGVLAATTVYLLLTRGSKPPATIGLAF
jgi:hypothetical protein